MALTFLDECVDRRLGSQLTEHEVSSAYSRRWLGLPDSVLLNRCANQFDAFVTLDSNLEYQQNIRALPFGVIVLKAGRGRLSELMPLLPALNAALSSIRPGQLIEPVGPTSSGPGKRS